MMLLQNSTELHNFPIETTDFMDASSDFACTNREFNEFYDNAINNNSFDPFLESMDGDGYSFHSLTSEMPSQPTESQPQYPSQSAFVMDEGDDANMFDNEIDNYVAELNWNTTDTSSPQQPTFYQPEESFNYFSNNNTGSNNADTFLSSMNNNEFCHAFELNSSPSTSPTSGYSPEMLNSTCLSSSPIYEPQENSFGNNNLFSSNEEVPAKCIKRGKFWQVCTNQGSETIPQEAIYEKATQNHFVGNLALNAHPNSDKLMNTMYVLVNKGSKRKPPKIEGKSWKCHTLVPLSGKKSPNGSEIKRWRYNIPGTDSLCKVHEWEVVDNSSQFGSSYTFTLYHYYQSGKRVKRTP